MNEEKYRFIITRKEKTLYYGYFHNDSPLELYLDASDTGNILGNIYAARVERVLPDMGGAFLELDQRQKCYYPLQKNGKKPLLLSPPHTGNSKSDKVIAGGDIILIQIAKDAVKSKLPVADDNISLTGKYFVLTLTDKRSGISKKIHDKEERDRLEELVQGFLHDQSFESNGPCSGSRIPEGSVPERDKPFGIIIRTNAAGADSEALLKELWQLRADYRELMRKASIAPGKTLLKGRPPFYMTYPADLPGKELSEIVTDQEDIYEKLKQFYSQSLPDKTILSKLRFYQDPYPLMKLYRLESHLEKALSKTVWLPSGGSLVIEPTEAMVVIDVNTAGVTRKKQKEEDLFYQINREAAQEIGRQLRLRNLSGIIVIDFINMRHGKHRVRLLNYLKEVCEKDRIPTRVMDITALNLVEMTRQKVRKPLHEQAKIILQEQAKYSLTHTD